MATPNQKLLSDLIQLHTKVVDKWDDLKSSVDDETEIVHLELFDELNTTPFECWFGDDELEAKANPFFPAFAEMGEGSYAALWLRENCDLDTAPVVIIGSEGDLLVIAPNYSTFIMISAAGYDIFNLLPLDLDDPRAAFKPFIEWAKNEFGWSVPENIIETIETAKKQNPNVEEFINNL